MAPAGKPSEDTMEDRNEHIHDENEPEGGDEPTVERPADEPTVEKPAPDEPTIEEGAPAGGVPEEPRGPQAPPPGGPAPEDPRGPQAPPAGEAPTEPPGAGAATGAGGGAGAGAGTWPGGPAGAAPQPKRLLRSRENRVLGGVCAGLGRYFNTDPVFFRIGAIVLALIGGAGVLLYLAALLLIPSGDPVGQGAAGAGGIAGGAGTAGAAGTAAPGSTDGRNRGLVIAGVVLLLLVAWPFLLGGGILLGGILIPLAVLVATGVLIWWLVSGEGPSGDAKDIGRRAALGIGLLVLCGIVAIGGAWAAAAGGETIVALLVIGAGVAIVAGAFLKPVRWLILPALALALSAGTVSAAGIDLDGGVGDRDYRPASVGDLRDRYELGIGELVVDMTNVDFPAGDTPLELDLGVGSARLVVPKDVCVATSADAGAGYVGAFQNDSEGIDVDFEDQRDAPPGTSRLVVDAELGVGELLIGHPGSEFWPQGANFDFDDDFERGHDPSNRGLNLACGERNG
jgi:phage shock protein PspC (stress-responsive transcriptional regulator)